MNCIDWEERIALHAGGDLAPAETAEVERHLADCPACRIFCDGLRETLATLHEAHRVEIPEDHLTAVRTSVIAEIERGRGAWRRLAWVSGVGIAAALILGIALRPGPVPPPPPRVALNIPQAPPSPAIRAVTVRERSRTHAPVLVKLQTADPHIVIYWIAD